MVGTRPLPIISNEIYLEIFEYLEPSPEMHIDECKAIWSNLADVCRFFCAHFMGKIYEEFTFEVEKNTSGSSKDKTRKYITRICRGINEKAKLHTLVGSRVQRCIIRNWPVGGNEDGQVDLVLGAFLGLYTTAITRMPSLHTLRLESTFIGEELFSAVLKCRHLTRLELVDCRFDSSEDMAFLATKLRTASSLGGLRIQNICVMSTTAPPEIAALFRKAICAWKGLAHWRTAGEFLNASDLSALRNPNKLHSLVLSRAEDPQHLADFLQSCTQLQRLEVTSHPMDFETKFIVNAAAVPLLTHLHSTTAIAQQLVKGRRITYLRLCWVEFSRVSAHFLENMKTLQSLSIPYLLYDPTITLPRLTYVSVEIDATRTLFMWNDVSTLRSTDLLMAPNHVPHNREYRFPRSPSYLRSFSTNSKASPSASDLTHTCAPSSSTPTYSKNSRRFWSS